MLASTCQNMALTLSGFRIRIGKIYLLLFLFASPFPEFKSQTIKLIVSSKITFGVLFLIVESLSCNLVVV